MNHGARSLILLSCLGLFLGCVSVNVGTEKPEKSNAVTFKEPLAPFERLKESSADQGWKNPKTGNTISYLSECPGPGGPLKDLAQELSGLLTSKQMVSQKEDFFNGREALRTQWSGKLEGIPMKLESVVFKKNGCAYTITYVGRSSKFEQEISFFETFLGGFQAP